MKYLPLPSFISCILCGLVTIGGCNSGSEGFPSDRAPADLDVLDDADQDLDGISDVDEGEGDCDNDGVPNYLDLDSDNDGIPDLVEGNKDFDDDGVGNACDLDSDGDGYSDAEERGDGDAPADNDEDRIPDFVDFDSDNDGLTDALEHTLGSDRTSEDSDDDGYDDLTEYVYWQDEGLDDAAIGAAINDATATPRDDYFYVRLPHDAVGPTVETLWFEASVQSVDVLVLVDVSGSMSDELDNLQQGIGEVIVGGIRERIADSSFGLATFDDIRMDANAGHKGFEVRQYITDSIEDITAAVGTLEVIAAGFEAHALSLYLTGSEEDFTAQWSYPDNGPFDVYLPGPDCTTELGFIGGACFRPGALPVVIMITDEAFWDMSISYFTWSPGFYPTVQQSIDSLNSINAKFIGVGTGAFAGNPMTDPDSFAAIATGTNSVSAMTGEPFLYTANSNGTGLSEQLVDGVVELVNHIVMNVSTATESIGDVVDTTQFITSIVPNSADPADGVESIGVSTFVGVKPGTEVAFNVTFQNDGVFVPHTTDATLFKAIIHVLGEGAHLDQRLVYIVVPGVMPDKVPF